jgi:hypothetical protein
MRKLVKITLVICLIGLIYEFTVHTVLAVDYQYGFSLDPPVHHFIVKPDFKNIGAEFTISNTQDPIYLQLQFVSQPEFNITIYDMDLDEIHAIDPKNNTFLLLPKTSKRFRVEISNISNDTSGRRASGSLSSRAKSRDPSIPVTGGRDDDANDKISALEENGLKTKDYVIDIEALVKLVQIPKNVRQPVVIEPKIHKYIVLGVTKDGNMSLDPKIALFQNVNGLITLLNGPQNIVATVQNRGNYMLSLGGTVTIKGPNNFTQQNTIPPTYIFANSQKNLSVEGQDVRSLIALPYDKLSTGQYTASIDLSIPGSNTPHLFGQTSFWLISPFYVIASTIFCLIIITIIFILGIRRT